MTEVLEIKEERIEAAAEPLVFSVNNAGDAHAARHQIMKDIAKSGEYDEDRLFFLGLVIDELSANPQKHIPPEEQVGYDCERDGDESDALLLVSPVRNGKVFVSVLDRHPQSILKVQKALHADPDPMKVLENEGSAGLALVNNLSAWVNAELVYDDSGEPMAKCVTAEVIVDPTAMIPVQIARAA